MTKIKLALIQMKVSSDKERNLQTAEQQIEQCARMGAELVVLPEMFCCPYQTSSFPAYAEQEGGLIWSRLSAAARRNQVYLVGGSMPELDDAGKVYNTCFIFDRIGQQIGKHRKMHLFDIAIRGGQHFRESDTLSPGSQVTLVETEFCKLGVAICYDLRFPELARLMVLGGAKIMVFPGAFNLTTGPAHWEILFRVRALDNQVYALGCAPARDESASYHSYGNSLVVSPWGDVLGRLGAEEGFLMQEIDLDEVERIRQELPLLQHRRTDCYEVSEP
jgi:predicted amidohydrolase